MKIRIENWEKMEYNIIVDRQFLIRVTNMVTELKGGTLYVQTILNTIRTEKRRGKKKKRGDLEGSA